MRIGRLSGALPLVLMTVLIVAVGAFATVRQDAFLTSFNLNNLLLLTHAARTRLARTDLRAPRRRLRRLGGGAHDVLRRRRLLHDGVRHVGLGAASRGPGARSQWVWRPGSSTPCSSASSSFRRSSRRSGRSASSRARRSSSGITPRARSRATPSSGLTKSVSFVPIAFIAVVVLAVLGDVWLYRTRTGLAIEGGRPRRDVVAPARDGDRPHRVPRVRRLLGDGVARRLLPRGPGPDRLAAHRQLRAREHRRRRPRRSEPRRRQRIVRGRAARSALPLADRQRPAAVPPADGVLRR